MSKTTRELVFEAADILLKEGVKPSQQNVREKIGKGSATTIHQALNVWWGSLSARIDHQNSSAKVPDFLNKALVEIWNQALDRSQTALNEKEQLLRETLGYKQQELDGLLEESRAKSETIASQLERAYDRIEQLQQDLEDSRKDVLGLEKELIKNSGELSELRRHEKAQQKIISKLEAKLAAEPENHSKTSTKVNVISDLNNAEQLDVLNRTSSGSKAGIVEENDNLKTTVSNLDGQLLERDSQLKVSQDELLEIKRRFYRLEVGLEGHQAQKEGELQGKIQAKDQEIDRLLALLADNR